MVMFAASAAYKRFRPAKTLKSAEFISDVLSEIDGVPTGDARGEVMPGLPKVPAAEKIDIDENGVINGLF
jgi:formyltetrahydrofolate synthetase